VDESKALDYPTGTDNAEFIVGINDAYKQRHRARVAP
jgi:hypothetical protein